LIALITFWLIFISAPLALAAIACGHLALSAIKHGAGRIYGKGIAIAGLALGYGSLVAAIALFAFVAGRPEVPKSPEQAALDAAEKTIGGKTGDNPFGNDAEARRMSTKFADGMAKLDQELFADAPARRSRADDYRTWCELHDGRCAFVVQVPGYRK
ncbi:DUF4190 domain-containing protein, partial [Corallococcus praedator]